LPARAYAGAEVRGLAIDSTNWQTAVVVDATSRVFITRDAGASYTDITGVGTSSLSGLTQDPHSIAFASAPGGTGTVFVGAMDGVYSMQTSAPGVWSRYASGMPHVAVYNLVNVPNQQLLVAATLGRGAFSIPSTGGSGNLTVTVNGTRLVNDDAARLVNKLTLTRTSTTGDQIVSLVSSDPNLATVPATATFLDGQATLSVDVTIVDDPAVGPLPRHGRVHRQRRRQPHLRRHGRRSQRRRLAAARLLAVRRRRHAGRHRQHPLRQPGPGRRRRGQRDGHRDPQYADRSGPDADPRIERSDGGFGRSARRRRQGDHPRRGDLGHVSHQRRRFVLRQYRAERHDLRRRRWFRHGSGTIEVLPTGHILSYDRFGDQNITANRDNSSSRTARSRAPCSTTFPSPAMRGAVLGAFPIWASPAISTRSTARHRRRRAAWCPAP